MRVMPRTASGKLSFFQSRLPKWAQNAAQIGLSEDEIAELEAKLDVAKAKFLAQRQAQNAALAATAEFHIAENALCNAGAGAILKVRATVRMKKDPKVYALASVPRPKKASPVEAPGQPSKFTFAVTDLGQVQLKWTCKNPRNSEGTMYEVHRSVDDGAMEFLGVSGKKRFTDSTVPPGAKFIIYKVIAFRSTKRGAAATFNVSFGVLPAYKEMVAMEQKREAA